jgi:hypothetical protein
MKLRTYLFQGGVVAALMAGLFAAAPVHAATPRFILSWQAGGYAPQWYEGKVLLGYHAPLMVSCSLIGQGASDAGKIIDLHNSEIRWYINSEFYTSGVGMQTLIIPQNDIFSGGILNVRASVNFFDPDTNGSSFVDGYLSIPVQSPEVVLSGKVFSGAAGGGSTLSIDAFPFFFNVPNDALSVSWFLNGSQLPAMANPFSVVVGGGSGGSLGSGAFRMVATDPGDAAFDQASGWYRFSF